MGDFDFFEEENEYIDDMDNADTHDEFCALDKHVTGTCHHTNRIYFSKMTVLNFLFWD